MDAFFRHRDGSFLGGWNQPLGSRVTQQTSYSYIVSDQRSTNLVADPPYTPRFGDSRRRVSVLGLSLRLANRTAAAPCRVPRRCRRGAEPDADGRLRVRRRARRADQSPLDGRAAAPIAQQHRHHRAVRSDHRTRVASLRHSFRKQRQLRFLRAPRVAVSWLVNPGSEALGATRLRASVGRGIKEPLFIQSYSPSPSFLGNPDLKPSDRADSTSRSNSDSRAIVSGSRPPTSPTTSTT